MKKKKIAIIADVPNWSFDIIAKLLKKELINYEIDIYYCVTQFQKDLFSILEVVKKYDIIHFLARKLLMQFDEVSFKKKVLQKGYNLDNYTKEIIPKVTTCVYDHLALEEEYMKIYQKYCRRYIVCSKKLNDIYSSIENCPKPWGEIRDTIDTELFVPANLERFKIENIKDRPLVIGWVGNSKWNKKTPQSVDYKGLETILKIAIKQLQQEGFLIETSYADVNEKYRNAKEMQEYYSTIDIYVCVSLIEGTPRPALEAMSCGVPIISTDVGVVEEVLGPKQKQFIMEKRSVEELKKKIQKLYRERTLFKELSEENQKQGIQNSSKTTISLYESFFDF